NTPYGLVTLNADGSYSFALANGSAAVEGLDQGEQVTLQYAYSMRDADNDPSSSTLTITITGSNDTPTVDVSTPNAGGDLAKVYEKGLPDGSSAGDGSTVTTGSFTVADSDGLANLKTLSVGSLSVDLTTSSFTSLVGQSFTTAHGTVQITGYSNGTYNFSYTLTEATTDAAGPETDGFLINVGDGLASASANVSIEIVDDLPKAKADSASLSEGGSVNGNVVSGAGLGSVADMFGADGRPSPTTGVVGVRAGGDTTTAASGSVGDPIDTGLGTLVLHADGSYTYTSHANSVGQAGAVDTFTYTIVDADGDLSTTTLTINVSNYTVTGSVQAGSDQDVREAALSFGSAPSSNDEFASGTLVGSGGNGPYSFSLAVGEGNGQYGQLVVSSTGAYAYLLVSAPKINPGDNGNNLQFTETFTFTVTDANGNTGTGILTVSIIDDVPDISVKGLGALGVQVDETNLSFDASTNFAGAFATVFGADGAAISNAITYSLNVKSAEVDSGLRDTATGNSILLSKVGSDIVGLVSGGGQIAFRLSVAADGTVTLDQQRAIVHTPDTGPDQVAGLSGADLITLSATVTDGDGDKDSATLNLGDAISFRDDAPAVTSNAVVQLDDDALPGGIANGSGDDPDSANTTGSVGFDFGVDGAGDVQWQTMGAPDGFSYVKSGTTLLIKQGTTTVIEVTLNSSTGAYGVTQLAPIQHALGGEENDQLFTLTYKVTDKDGDSTNGTLDIKVDDDTPSGKNDSADVAEGSGQGFNVVFVLDFSGSIDDTELNTMLNAVRNAGQTLFSTTDGDVRIQLVAFSGTAASYPVVTDVTGFINLVNSLNPAEGGARPFSGNTDFTAAIQQTMAVYTPLSSWSNQVFFISDGNPNEQTGPGDTSLTSAVATQWNNFVDNNGINVTTIGVGNGINTPRLQDVDVDGSGSPIMVAAFEDLVETLASQIVGGVVSGNVLLGSDNAVGGGDDDAFGADGAGRIQSIQIGTTTYTWNGASTIALSTGGSLSGSQLSAITTPGGGKLSFDFTTGTWTYVAPKNVAADTSESFTYSIIDKDGDPSSASLTVRIEDASPVIGRVDEDELPGGITDGDAQTTVVTGNLGELLVGTPVGAQFGVAAIPQAMPVLTSDGVTITYSRVGDTLVAKAGTETVFTLQVASNGVYTFTLLGALDHPNGAGGDDQILTLNLTGALQASNASGNLPLAGDLLIQVEDDIPAILQTSNLVFSNGDSVAGASGVFVYSTGSDTRGNGPFSASDSDFTSIGLTGSVGGVAISSTAVTWVSESATSAIFDITFNYAPNAASPGTLEQANGTLTFDKVNGTYSVALDEPIQGFTIFKTSTSISISGYEVNSTLPDSTQPAVAVVELDNDFFVQYTSYAEPGGGTDGNNLRAGTSTTSTFTDGELFNQTASWVSVSNAANGVAGDTLGKGEVLDLNFYTSNPKGNLGVEPSARAEGMFLKFDGVNGEDLVVVLKLVGAGGAKTTRALVVSSADIMTANSVALAAYGITLDNNDGAIVIEKNDFNAPGENWQIYGAQILTSVEGIASSSAVNFNSTIGSGGASDVSDRVSFTSSATDNDVLKVSDVGFITGETSTLDASLNFQVGIRDADGDTASSQVLQVNLESSTTFVGTASDDVIQGTSGNDHLTGLAGNDVLVGGAGNDVLDGGLGNDTASYSNAASSVAVNLALVGQQNTGGGGLDTLIDVENLLGSHFNDVLAGNSGNNVLAGNGGDDQLTGGGGADTFKWLPGESGITTITDFTPGVDKLDLSQLLTGEHSNAGSLDDYLTMAFGANTTITVDSNADAPGGTGQTVVLQGVNLMAAYGAPDTASVITHMLDDGSLKVDA
ncbi:type I secretion C-terminal target domain-containing protein, partial [Pseudomonas sp. BN414]|nr:type I secretion C-terminal target domain-containing protein [Pseudomonas sp. BN414]